MSGKLNVRKSVQLRKSEYLLWALLFNVKFTYFDDCFVIKRMLSSQKIHSSLLYT